MRAITKTWGHPIFDGANPCFTLEIRRTATTNYYYECKFNWFSSSHIPAYCQIIVTSEEYEPGIYYTKNADGDFSLCYLDYSEFDTYYIKPKIQWKVTFSGKNTPSSEELNKVYSGEFSLDELQSNTTLLQFEFYEFAKTNGDYIIATAEINWNGYTFLNRTRNYEEISGKLYLGKTTTLKSILVPPEIVRYAWIRSKTDEVSFNWQYNGWIDNVAINYIIWEMAAGGYRVERANGVFNYDSSIYETYTQSYSIGNLSNNLSTRSSLYCEAWTTDSDGNESPHDIGIICQINDPPNKPQIELSGNNIIVTDNSEVSFNISANTTREVPEETEEIIISDGQLLDKYTDIEVLYLNSNKKFPLQENFANINLKNYDSSIYQGNKIILLNKSIEIDGFSSLKINAKYTSNSYRVGLISLEDSEKDFYNIWNKSNIFVSVGASLTEGAINLSLYNLDKAKKWYLFVEMDTNNISYLINSIKFIKTTELTKFNFLSNDPDNTVDDYLNLSENLWFSIDNGKKYKVSNHTILNSNQSFHLNISKELLESLGISLGQHTFNVYAYDELEYSEPSSWKFSFYPDIVFTKTSIESQLYPSEVSGEQVASQVTFDYYLKNYKYDLDYTVFIRWLDENNIEKISTIPKKNCTFQNIYDNRKKIHVNLRGLRSNLKLQSVRTVQLTFKLFYPSNSNYFIEYKDDNEYILIDNRLEKSFQNSILLTPLNTSKCSKEKFYSRDMEIKIFQPEPFLYYPAPSLIKCWIISEDELYEEELKLENDCWSKTITLDKVQPGEIIYFIFAYYDISGYEITIEESSDGLYTFTRASPPNFASEKISLNPVPIKPYSSLNQNIVHSLAEAQGTISQTIDENGEIIEGITYSYQISFLDKTKTLTSFELNVNDIAFQRELTLNQEQIQTLYEINTYNEQFEGILTITATDSFGQSTSISQSFNIDHREAPYWPQNQGFDILHDYNINRATISNSDLINLSMVENNNKNTQMFCADEGIVLKIPKPLDKNGEQDVNKFIFYLLREDLLLDSQPIFNKEKIKEWITVSVEDMVDGNDGFYYYRYKASKYLKNEFFYFAVVACDSTNLISTLLNTSFPIFGCRTISPNFNQGAINIQIEEKTEQWKIDLKWNDFIIKDLGGSSTEQGWNLDYYNNYPNLERTLVDFNKDIYFLVEISSLSEFDDPGKIINRQLRHEGITNYIDFKPYGVENLKTISLYLTPEELSQADLKNSEKVYFRFTLFASYVYNGYIQSTPQFISYFGNLPTVSHRAHHVGINNNSFEDDDTFVISSYKNRNKIRFIGVDSEGTEHQIIIDLNNGIIFDTSIINTKIDNANLSNSIIDGGTW